MGAKEIYKQLRSAGLTVEGACGLLGNMQAESGLQANIAQRGMTNLTDKDYTAAADMGLIDFAHDDVGYGLCQWTHPDRKKNFLAFAKAECSSIGNEATQVKFCIKELREDYGGLYAYLCSTDDLNSAVERICKEYERPAINNINVRYLYAQKFYSAFAGKEDEPAEPGEESFWPPRMLDYKAGRENLKGADVLALQAILAARGYDCPTTGDFDAKTRLATMAFQAESGLIGDGVAGRATWAKILKGE